MTPIARRYFIKNGFDGSMTMLGIIIGSWLVRVTKPEIIVTAGLGACFAMGVSGLFGAYMTEKAERKRQLKTLENAMLTDLKDSIINDASDFVSIYAAIVDGASPIVTAVISLVPFILTLTGTLAIWNAYIASIILTLVTLFSLGLYLGKIAKGNVLLYGAQSLAAGILIVAIVILLGVI
jgi:predicted membrane protein (TIGR00267 family)